MRNNQDVELLSPVRVQTCRELNLCFFQLLTDLECVQSSRCEQFIEGKGGFAKHVRRTTRDDQYCIQYGVFRPLYLLLLQAVRLIRRSEDTRWKRVVVLTFLPRETFQNSLDDRTTAMATPSQGLRVLCYIFSYIRDVVQLDRSCCSRQHRTVLLRDNAM
jgi:hypothetical protein